MERTITVSEALYEILQREASRQQRTPDAIAEDLLTQELLPQHPHVDMVTGIGGPRPVIRGTRVGVDVILGYSRAGYSPETIADEILPHLTPAEVYDALSYAHDHPERLAAPDTQTVDVWRRRLRQRLGPDSYARLTGSSADA